MQTNDFCMGAVGRQQIEKAWGKELNINVTQKKRNKATEKDCKMMKRDEKSKHK